MLHTIGHVFAELFAYLLFYTFCGLGFLIGSALGGPVGGVIGAILCPLFIIGGIVTAVILAEAAAAPATMAVKAAALTAVAATPGVGIPVLAVLGTLAAIAAITLLAAVVGNLLLSRQQKRVAAGEKSSFDCDRLISESHAKVARVMGTCAPAQVSKVAKQQQDQAVKAPVAIKEAQQVNLSIFANKPEAVEPAILTQVAVRAG